MLMLRQIATIFGLKHISRIDKRNKNSEIVGLLSGKTVCMLCALINNKGMHVPFK